jgi:hypothetical protein
MRCAGKRVRRIDGVLSGLPERRRLLLTIGLTESARSAALDGP